MSESVNELKAKAVDILMDEAFSYTKDLAYQEHVNLAEENAKIRGMQAKFFTYGGQIYPTKFPNGASIQGLRLNAPPLHFSLMQRFDDIVSKDSSFQRTAIKNYFAAVMTASAHKLVINEFLPTVLISRLKKEFGAIGYELIDNGGKDRVPRDVTQAIVEEIKKHYAGTMAELRDLLMERFLLQE